MLNDHITEELDRFQQVEGPAFYALQIDAEWGAGKTHFVRSYLYRTCRPAVVAGSVNPEPRYLMLSLFGVMSVSELESQMVAQLFSENERLLGRLASSVVGGAASFLRLGGGPQAEVENQGPRLLSDRLARLRTNKGIVVFDDIERTRMPLRDALGYINRFVEHEGFKVLLVTNEASLRHSDSSAEDKANLQDLQRFKEKIVGRTLALSPVPDEAYDVFVKLMSSQSAKCLASHGREKAISLFHASRRNNLRSLRMGLEAFDRLVPLFECPWLEQAEAMQEVLLGCLLVAMEHGAGTAEEAIGRLTNSPSEYLFGRGRTSPADADPVDKEAHRIFSTYENHLNLSEPPISFQTIAALVSRGKLLTEEILKGMSESPMVIGHQEAPPWRILINIWSHSTDDVQKAITRAKEQFEKLELTDPGELLHLAGIMLWYEKHGDLSISDGKPVYSFFEDYFVRLRRGSNQLSPNLQPFERAPYEMVYGYAVIGAQENLPDFSNLINIVRRAVLNRLRDRFPEYRKHLLVELEKSDRDLSTNGIDRVLIDAIDLPIFEGWEAKPFADVLMRDGRFDIDALKWLARRYSSAQDLTSLIGEARWFEDLYTSLQQRISGSPPPSRHIWQTGLDIVMGSARERFQKLIVTVEKDELPVPPN